MTEKPLHEELRALARWVQNCTAGKADREYAIELLLALAARAEREQSPEREAFVEAASAMAAELVTWGAVSGPPGTREFLSAYRAMLAAEEKREEGR